MLDEKSIVEFAYENPDGFKQVKDNFSSSIIFSDTLLLFIL